MARRLSKRQRRAIERNVKKAKSKNTFIYFLVYLIFGLYLLNVSFHLFLVPEFVLKFDNFLISIGGVLLLISGVRFLNSRR